MKLKRIIILVLFSLSVSTAVGQNFFPILGGQRVGTSVFTFLKIGVSARAVGMGEAVAALSQDASSLYYNPAALGQSDEIQVLATHIEWPADINYDFFGVGGKIYGNHYLGLSAGILHMQPMMETTEYLPDGTGNYFTFQNNFIGLTYSAAMTDRFSFGLTVKHVEETLAGNMMSVWLMDMGTFYWTGFKSLRFSAVLSHFGPQAGLDGTYQKKGLDKFTGEEITTDTDYQLFTAPTVFRVGVAMEVLETEKQVLTWTVQLNHPVDDAENVVMGGEYSFMNTLVLRGGYKFNKDEETFSYGVGLKIPMGKIKLKIDYAYTNFIHLSDPMRLSVGISL